MNAWVIHRNVDIFGADANDFNPDRWLDSDAAANMDKYMFAFGGGSRTCIGRNFAMAAMSKLVPEFLRQFDIELADPKREMKFDNHWSAPPPPGTPNSLEGSKLMGRFIKPDHVWVKVRPRT